MNNIKLAPSKARILNMDIDTLLSYYSLIQFKKSKLSSTQRKRIENRVAYLLNKKKIDVKDLHEKKEEVQQLINKEK